MALPQNIATMDGDKKIDGIQVWDIRNAADTLVRAEEIKANKKLNNLASKFISEKLLADIAAKKTAAEAAAKKTKVS